MDMMDLLGLKVQLSNWEKINNLPVYISHNFKIQRANINGINCLSIMPKDELPNLVALKRQIQKIHEVEPLPVFVQTDTMSKFRKENLLKNNIPFIIKDKQAYLPFMAVFLINERYQSNIIVDKLTTSAQLLFIWILYQEGNEFFISDALDTLKFSNMTLTRAYRQLVSTGIFTERKKGRRIYLSIECTKKELFERMKPYLKNPVVKSGYIMKSQMQKDMVCAGDSALAHYTFINPPKMPVYAIHKSRFLSKQLSKELINYEEQVEIEVWDYEPMIFSDDPNYVDALSLIITLLNVVDERIEIEIDELLVHIFEKSDQNNIEDLI